MVFFTLGRMSHRGAAKGLVDGKLAPLSSKPNCVCSEDGTPSRKCVDPLPTNDMAAIKAAITSQGGEISTHNNDYLAATFTSKIYKFVDDVEVRLEGGNAHIRSASRVGYSDRGVNRKRVAAIRAALK